MDSLSHSCFSYLVCRSSGTAPSPRVGLVAATVALLPDLDFLLIPVLPELAQFAFHRGPSHSLFMAAVMGITLGTLLYRWLGLSRSQASLLVSLAWFSHIILDMCTGFGVALLWPLTHARSSVDLLFVVDPLATFPLLAAMLWDVRSNWRTTKASKPLKVRRSIPIAGLTIWAVYALISVGIRTEVKREFHTELQQRGYEVLQIHAEPTPFNNQLWYLCAKTENSFVITYRSIWDGKNWERWTELDKRQKPLSTFADNHPLSKKMGVVLEDWFTVQSVEEDQIDVIDLRLGKRYGWEEEDAPFLFIYNLRRTEGKLLNWSMEKPESRYDFGRLQGLYARLSGHIPSHRLQAGAELKNRSSHPDHSFDQ